MRKLRKITDDDFDEFGVLRDGHKMRVPMVMMDAAPRYGGHHKPGFVLADKATGDAKQRAYEDYDREISQAYKHDGAPLGAYPYSAAAEGSACTIDGRPGRLVKENGSLVCRPIRQDGLSTHDAKAAAYAAYDAEISNAWRRTR